jgi:putative acyl-CoA dehydrogenase
MTVQHSLATHEVLNQSPPFEDVDLFTLDRPLAEAVAANGGTAAQQELSEFGQHWGSAAMAARGRVANENTPKLRTFDARGNRRDEVEFHPAYHELMAHSAHAGVHNSTWNAEGKPAAVPPKWCAPRNSTWRRKSRPVICARSP